MLTLPQDYMKKTLLTVLISSTILYSTVSFAETNEKPRSQALRGSSVQPVNPPKSLTSNTTRPNAQNQNFVAQSEAAASEKTEALRKAEAEAAKKVENEKPVEQKPVDPKAPIAAGLLITTPEKFKAVGKNNQTGLTIDGIDILSNDKDIAADLNKYVGQNINKEFLDNVITRIIKFMREKNQPVVDVYFPEQDITDGKLVVVVSRAVVGDVIVSGNKYYSKEAIGKNVTAKSGEFIYSDQLSKDLRWINSNPYRSVDVIFKPGQKQGSTDIVLETKDMYPMRVFGGIDNYGSPTTTENQFNLGFSYGNLWGLDHEVVYNFISSWDYANFNAHVLQYNIPFEWRHKLHLTGTVSESNPKSSTNVISQTGQNYTFNAEYEIPLYDWGVPGFTQDLKLGFDYKRLENAIEFGGTNVYNSKPEVVQFYATYDGSKTTAKTVNILSASIYGAPGELTSNNTKADFETAQAGADPAYAFLRSLYETRYTFDEGITLAGIFRGQYSFGSLLSSEQLPINGIGAVRSFATNTVRRDNALVSTIELSTPYVPVIDEYFKLGVRDRIQGFTFVDYGFGSNNDEFGTDSSIDLSSAGLGIRFGVGRYTSGVIEWGQELHDELNDGTDRHLSFRVNFSY
jgi:hemolysin activation/secretion protein